MLKHKVSVLSVHHKFNKLYIPVFQTRNIPAAVICLHDPSKEKASNTEVLACTKLAKYTYKIRDKESSALKESTIGFN